MNMTVTGRDREINVDLENWMRKENILCGQWGWQLRQHCGRGLRTRDDRGWERMLQRKQGNEEETYARRVQSSCRVMKRKWSKTCIRAANCLNSILICYASETLHQLPLSFSLTRTKYSFLISHTCIDHKWPHRSFVNGYGKVLH